MLTVEDYGRIRRTKRDGMSIREIARVFHHSRKKVREVLKGSGEPKPYQQREQQVAPMLGAFHETILEILKEDETAPPKQRHTMMHGNYSAMGSPDNPVVWVAQATRCY